MEPPTCSLTCIHCTRGSPSLQTTCSGCQAISRHSCSMVCFVHGRKPRDIKAKLLHLMCRRHGTSHPCNHNIAATSSSLREAAADRRQQTDPSHRTDLSVDTHMIHTQYTHTQTRAQHKPPCCRGQLRAASQPTHLYMAQPLLSTPGQSNHIPKAHPAQGLWA